MTTRRDRRGMRVALLASVLGLAGCSLPYFTTSHVDPADAAWVVVVANAGNVGVPIQYRLDDAPPVRVLPELVAFVRARHDGYVERWVASPDGRRIACVEHFPEGPSWTMRVCVAATSGPPWRVVELPGAGEPLAWSPDGRSLLCADFAKTGANEWRSGFALVDVDSGAPPRRFLDVGRGDGVQPANVAFSPDGARLAFETNDFRVAVLDLETGAVQRPALPDAGDHAGVLGWLADGRIAYRTADRRVLFARPGDATAAVFPTDADDEWPVSARPDGVAVLVTVERSPMLSIYVYHGGLVRYADGGKEDLDFVEGEIRNFPASCAVWFRAPGLPGAPVR